MRSVSRYRDIMVTIENAIQLVTGYLPENVAVMPNKTIEKPYGWIVFSQSKEFVETKDSGYILIGWGPTFVAKETGQLVQLGSHRGFFDEILACYESGFQDFINCSIVITKVEDSERTSEIISYLMIRSAEQKKYPDKDVLIREKKYRKQVSKLLESLPCTIYIGHPLGICRDLEMLKDTEYFDFYLQENEGNANGA